MIELKACPFCGNPEVEPLPGDAGGEWYVWCYNCGADGPYSSKSKEAAVIAWNKRMEQITLDLAWSHCVAFKVIIEDIMKNLHEMGADND